MEANEPDHVHNSYLRAYVMGKCVRVPLPIFNATVKRTVNNYNKYTSQLKLKGKRQRERVSERDGVVKR